MKELAAALAKAQGEVKAAIKDSENPAFKRDGAGTRYADLASVWNACRAALTKHGLSVVQATEFDANDLWLETILLHSSGESMKGRYPLRPQVQTPQGYGSALTYARRYALAAMVGVVADEDDDGNEASTVRSNGNGHHEPSRRNESDAVRRAREWTNDQIAELNQMKSMDKFDVWLDRWQKDIAALKKNVPDEHEALNKAMTRAQMRLQPQASNG